MPVARIVTRNLAQQYSAVKELSAQLRAAGYEVELTPPGATADAADLVVEIDELPAGEALDAAVRLAQKADSDLFVAPGLIAAEALTPSPLPGHLPVAGDSAITSEAAVDTVEAGPRRDTAGRGVLGDTFQQVGSALADARSGIRESAAGFGQNISSMRERFSGAWSQFQQRRNDAIRALRLERERREQEREDHRRQHELELRRQSEEKQRLIAERERLAADQERVLREQMAREAAVRAERERVQREATAREAAQRAELAHAAQQERRRLDTVQEERMRLQREQEEQYAAARRAQRLHQQREAEAERLRQMREAGAQHAPSPTFTPVQPRVTEQPAAPLHAGFTDAAPQLKPKPRRRPRRLASPRERQWQQAALLASVATLAAMIGFAIAANVRPSSPLPASLLQNGAQQQVPFGPAKMDLSVVDRTPAAPVRSRSHPASVPSVDDRSLAAEERGVAHSRAATLQKPSPAKPVVKSRARRSTRASEVTADDEVIVRRIPAAPAQHAQTTAGVRRYTDED
jgi:hypothetical protein